MLKGFVAAALGVAFALTPASADQAYVDSESTFELTLPEGWTTEKSPDADTKLVLNSPRKDATGANCRVLAGADPASAKSRKPTSTRCSRTK